MKLLDIDIQAAVDDGQRLTPYRILVEVTVGATVYRWATGTLTFDPGTGPEPYEGRLIEVGQVNGLILDGLRNSAAKRTFDFAIADRDGHLFASMGAGAFSGAPVVMREIFDGVAAQGREHHFFVEGVSSQGRGKLRFECASKSPLTSDTTVGITIEAGDFALADEGLIGTPVPTIYGSRKLALRLISAEEGRFLVATGTYTIDSLTQNGSPITEGAGADEFTVDPVTTSRGVVTTIVFNTPSYIRNVAVSGAPVLPVVATVTRTDSYVGGSGEVGEGLPANNPVNVFMDLWLAGEGDPAEVDIAFALAAGASMQSDGIAFNCAIPGGRAVGGLLANLLLCCGGRVIENDKLYLYRSSGAPANPTTFGPDNILRSRGSEETSFTRSDLSLESIHNRGIVTFEKWDVLAEDANPEVWRSTYQNDASVAAIGIQERTDAGLFIGDWAVADLAVQALIRQEVAGLREYTFETTLQAMAVDEGDHIAVSWPDFGLVDQTCLVTRMARLSSRRVQVTCRELPGVWWVDLGPPPTQPLDDDPALQPPPAPAWAVPAITQTTRTEADGTVFQDLLVDWEPSSHPVISGYHVFLGMDVPVGIDGEGNPTNLDQLIAAVAGTQLPLSGVPVGVDYRFRVRATTGVGLYSPLSTEQTHTVTAKAGNSATITGLAVAYTPFGFELFWDAPTDRSIRRFHVAVSDGAGGYTVLRATASVGTALDYVTVRDALPAGESLRNGTFYVRTVDSSDNLGPWASVGFTKARPSAPIIDPPTHGFLSIFLTSSPPLGPDIVRREWQVVSDADYLIDGWDQGLIFSAARATGAVFAGEDGTTYHFRARDIDWIADVLGSADIDLIDWSNEETDTTEIIPPTSIVIDSLANMTTKNFVRNAGFERWGVSTMPDFWSALISGTAAQVPGLSGAYAVRVSSPAPNDGIVFAFTADVLNRCQGREITVSFSHQLASATTARVRAVTDLSDSGDLGLVTAAGTWERAYFSWTVPSGATSLGLELQGDAAGGGQATDFDEVMVQLGDMVTAWEPHDLDFLAGEGGVTETEIADDAISTPKLKANAVVAKHILAGQIGARYIVAAADRVVVSGTVYKCIQTHGAGSPGIYDQGDYQPGVTGGWAAFWDVDAGADTTFYPSWVGGVDYYAGTFLGDQLLVSTALLGDAHIGTLSADKLTAGTIDAAQINIFSSDGSYWDATGIHLGTGASITWSSVVDDGGKPDDNATSNLVYRQATDPAPVPNGTFWYRTTDFSLWHRASGIWTFVGSGITGTSQITDDANFSGTADWSGVTNIPESATASYVTAGGITSTTITSANVASPTLSANGVITGVLQVGTYGAGSGIRIDAAGGGRVHHGYWNNAASQFGFDGNGAAYFRGYLDNKGTYGKCLIWGDQSTFFQLGPAISPGVYQATLSSGAYGGPVLSLYPDGVKQTRCIEGSAFNVTYAAAAFTNSADGGTGIFGTGNHQDGIGVRGDANGLAGRGVWGNGLGDAGIGVRGAASGQAGVGVNGYATGSGFAGGSFSVTTISGNAYGVVTSGPYGSAGIGYGGSLLLTPTGRTAGATPTHSASNGTIWVDSGGRPWIRCYKGGTTKWWAFDLL